MATFSEIIATEKIITIVLKMPHETLKFHYNKSCVCITYLIETIERRREREREIEMIYSRILLLGEKLRNVTKRQELFFFSKS